MNYSSSPMKLHLNIEQAQLIMKERQLSSIKKQN